MFRVGWAQSCPNHLVTISLFIIWRESFGMMLLEICVHFNSLLFQMEYEYQTIGGVAQLAIFVWQRCSLKRERVQKHSVNRVQGAT